MTEQLLDDTQIGAVLEEMRRKRVSECVRADPVIQTGVPSGGQCTALKRR